MTDERDAAQRQADGRRKGGQAGSKASKVHAAIISWSPEGRKKRAEKLLEKLALSGK